MNKITSKDLTKARKTWTIVKQLKHYSQAGLVGIRVCHWCIYWTCNIATRVFLDQASLYARLDGHVDINIDIHSNANIRLVLSVRAGRVTIFGGVRLVNTHTLSDIAQRRRASCVEIGLHGSPS